MLPTNKLTYKLITLASDEMGIDIGFTDESLKKCKYALCRPYRVRIVAIYSEPPEQGQDELAPYRQIDKVVNMNLLEQEEPRLYKELTKDEPPFAKRDYWYWNKGWFKDYYTNKRKTRRVKPYVQERPSGKVWLRKMPKELAKEYLAKTEEENLISAWWETPFDKHREICKPCLTCSHPDRKG